MAKSKKFVADNLQLMNEWNWVRNNELNLNPNEISYGSGIKVWWKCEKGHEWETTPNHRSRGRGCPICANEDRAKSHSDNWINQKGSLETLNPELASEWHPTKNGDLLPSHITVNNGKKSGGFAKTDTSGKQKLKVEIMVRVVLYVPGIRF